MTLVDGPDTAQSESTETHTGNEGDNGDPANTETPGEDFDEPPEQESDDQDQGGLQEDHTSPADGDLGLGITEEQEEVTFTGDYLPVFDDIDNTPTSKTVEKDQGVHQLERLANKMDEKFEEILRSVKRTSGDRDSTPAESPNDPWSISSQRHLKFEDPKPKVVFFEPETISRGPTRRDSQAWNEVINNASKQADVHKTPGKQDLANFSTRNKVLQQKQVVIDGEHVTLVSTAKPHGGLNVRLYDKRKRSQLSPEGLDYF